ncbi:glycosyltransferase family 4 protein [Ammoniphilus sp. CFH 90114]|uniref:glycosyltransferase family 4 protein n=1 Tax=Ammoniphilus sp. CFH 90114 TaxID=2493665 RepID=UPI00100E05DE|nr:glycosyltransferase family 4 protein [Ammoniphilus sp. CFH 90114]RXT13966.1 glycosyltransferase family 1 protein [Ammoniphilus sp. CFH 90114]
MKIAIISPGSFSVPPVIGSSVEHDIQMVAEQLEQEHEVTVYAKKCPEYRRSEKIGDLHYKRFIFMNSSQYLHKIMQHMHNDKPDIVMVENRPLYVLYLKEKFPELPVVLNMHSTVFASPPCISREAMKRVAKKADALITNSRYLRNYYVKSFPAFQGKAHAVHLGIDPKPFEKAQDRDEKIAKLQKKLKIRDGDITLLFVGRLLKEKGIHLILDVMPKLVKDYPNLKLIITGASRYGRNVMTPYVRKIQNKTKTLGNHVTFTNFIKPHKIPYIYQLADLVVIPSVWQEPFGRVNLEAMASAKAIVASDRGGIPEVVKHKKNGLIVSLDRDQQELYDSIRTLLESEELREEFGKKGMEYVRKFSWTRTAKKYVRIYEKLVGNEVKEPQPVTLVLNEDNTQA